MPPLHAGLSCCALLLWRCATAGEASADGVLAGPWVEIGPGGARLGVLLADPPPAGHTWIRRGANGGVALVPACEPSPRLGAPRAVIALVPLPQDAMAGSWRVDPQPSGATSVPWQVVVPAKPLVGATQRFVIAGRWTWPTVADIEAAKLLLGGPVDAVLPLGQDWRLRLGDGGWESHLPVLDPGPGGTWGELGLGVEGGMGEADAARALVNAVATWRILLPASAPWDPGLGAGSVDHGPGVLDARVHIAARLHCPLILAPSHGTGMISEPLDTTGGGRLRTFAGGPRYALLPPGGEGFVRIADKVALPLDEAALTGLVVGPEALRLAVAGAGQAQPVQLEWRRDGDKIIGSGTGAGDREALAIAAFAETPDAQALERLLWLPAEEFIAAVERDVSGRRLGMLRERIGASVLLRRLAVLPSVWDFADSDPRLQRDAIMRRWASDLIDEERWHDAAVRTQDPMLVRALTEQAVVDQALLALLVERLRLQADGVLPLDPDPLLLHRVLATVFDSPLLSPTPLRPIAAALSARVPLAVSGPLLRFQQRHGAVRP